MEEQDIESGDEKNGREANGGQLWCRVWVRRMCIEKKGTRGAQ